MLGLHPLPTSIYLHHGVALVHQ